MSENTVLNENTEPFASESTFSGDISQLDIEVFTSPEQVVEPWKTLEIFAHDPFSNYAWAKAWYDAHEAMPDCSPVIIVGRDSDHRPHFLLPLFRQKIGPSIVLFRPGKTHSAYFSGLFSPQCRQMINSDNAKQFWTSVFSVVPWADALVIDGLRETEIARGNPLKFLPRINSSNPSYQLHLSRDWEALYQSKLNGKARGNIRRCEKRLSEQGDLQFRIGTNRQDCLALVRDLLAQKAVQFAERQIIDPYEMENISSFYENLAQVNDEQAGHCVILSAMFLDDRPLAVNLGMTQNGEFHGLVMSMVSGEFARFSPGRILLLRSMGHLCERGIEQFDFGVGEANYKEGLVDRRIERYHVLAPLSVKGRVLVFGLRQASAIKARIKSSRWASEMTKRARWNFKKD